MCIVLVWKRNKWRHTEEWFAKVPPCVDGKARARTPVAWPLRLHSQPQPLSSMARDGDSRSHRPSYTQDKLCLWDKEKAVCELCPPKEKRIRSDPSAERSLPSRTYSSPCLVGSESFWNQQHFSAVKFKGRTFSIRNERKSPWSEGLKRFSKKCEGKTGGAGGRKETKGLRKGSPIPRIIIHTEHGFRQRL